MEFFRILKFWRNVVADEDDSFFDLVFKPISGDGGAEGVRKEFQFVESPRDVLPSTDDFTISTPAVTLRGSSPNFKILFGFKKSAKCEKSESLNPLSRSDNSVSVKCRLEEFPVSRDFARNCSLRSRLDEESPEYETSSDVVSPEKPVPLLRKLIRPLYQMNSKKVKLMDFGTPSSSPIIAPVSSLSRNFSEGSRTGVLKIGSMKLTKSRSASVSGMAIGVAPPLVPRTDDSLLEQHDRIQGAILHCKKSYISSSKGTQLK